MTGRMRLVCERGDPSCTDTIELTESEYESVRADAELFVTAKGHATHGASA